MRYSLNLIASQCRYWPLISRHTGIQVVAAAIVLGCAIWSVAPHAESAVTSDKPEIDLVHFWISPGERASLDVIKTAFVAAGGIWHESQSLDYERMRRDVVIRLAVGLPPSAMWWGTEDRTISKVLDFLRPVPELAPSGWGDQLNAAARLVIGNPDQALQLPLTIHNENWAWYNGRLYRQLKLPIPRSWSEFLNQAPELTAHGIIPLAVGDQPFSVSVLFNVVVAGVAGRENFVRLFSNRDATVLNDPAMRRALETFLELRRWSSKPDAASTWDAATRLVRDGHAAMQVMGDWARAEFDTVSVSSWDDIICAPPPDSAGIFVVAVDMLAFPKEVHADKGQRLLAQVVLRPDIQIKFANHKGATPVLKNFDAMSLHECSRLTLPLLLENRGAAILSARTTLPEGPRTRIIGVVYRHWQSSSSTASELAADLTEALQPQWSD